MHSLPPRRKANDAPLTQAARNAAIRATDDDAAQARLSAVRKLYLEDPYIALFVPRAHLVRSRAPLINIGTFVRSEAIDRLVKNWISLASSAGPVQIVSLGAGSDTRFWRLSSTPLKAKIHKYVELDFEEIVETKIEAIRQHPLLGNSLGPDVVADRSTLKSEILHLVSTDLNKPVDEILPPLLNILSTEKPTLLLAECVLPYLAPQVSSRILKWFCSEFGNLGAISYEMLFDDKDPFGNMMRKNLKIRNIDLLGVNGTIPALEERYTQAGFATTQTLTLEDIRTSHLPTAELERIAKLELVDELEELKLILSHYVIGWAFRAPDAELPSLEKWSV